jgi:hypothetical protein
MGDTDRKRPFWTSARWMVLAIAAISALLATTGASCGSSPSGINNQPATAGSGSPSTSATAAPVAHLGASVVISGNNNEQLTVQLVKIVDPASGADQFTTAAQGMHFVAVQFRLLNSGTVAYSDSPDNDAKVLDAQGQSFSPDFSATTAGPGFASNSVNIAPGASQLGFITFQLPNADSPAKVQFTTDSGFGQTGEWAVT